ncbi:acyltransferase [Opacimonas viscosa]|uniref:Acyltransferase n=1 Tax=Opacimonas viscosa TaxID=2961944 RepID=A0AA41WYL6_9ALTE|nr:acyltransferase [Opacimonas viscosa]MCP3428490.1 acyltransferase [Opacimonas viscosa]
MKSVMQWLIALLIFPYFALYKILSLITTDKDSLWQSFTQFLSLFPGKLGSYLRVRFMYWTATECHKETFIGFGALFSHCDTSIDDGVYIGPQCNIGKCSIGKNTLLGSGVHILSGKKQHEFSDPGTPIKEQGGVFEKISIGENCWIGNGAIVMASVGDNSVIAAGSVVVNELPAGVIVGGNPGKVIKQVGL